MKKTTRQFRLDDQVAVVTGAAKGVGAATARVLAALGARVAALDSDGKGVKGVVKTLETRSRAYVIDVADVEYGRRTIKAIARDFGRIDILINVAGVCPRLPFMTSTVEDWDQLFKINARSQFFLIQAVCPFMKRVGGGRIVNVASTAGRTGTVSNASIYSGTKGAIAMFTKSIAREVAADNILVNCVAPGVLNTRMMWSLPAEKRESLCQQIPLKRFGQPEEIAYCIAFLASKECSYATGATFDINGGWLMI